MPTDLKNMSVKELERLLKDVKSALQNAHVRNLKQAKKAAEKAAAQYGVSLNDLRDTKDVAVKAPKRKAKKAVVKSAPKYADPADASRTWTGKGRQPTWFRTAVENGTAPNELLI